MNQEPRYSPDEFDRESRYIDNLIWDALVVEPNQRVLFCGFGEDGRWVKRAVEAGALVTVIEHRDEIVRKFESAGVTVLKGSTSVIPAKPDSFDLAIAFHYLHETDPFFHSQILSELARVARRTAIVEPGPPADTIGKRIAALYSQAKRQMGQFEYYQPLDYWRKLLQSTKADISQYVFAFAKMPPVEYLRDTIALLLDTMKAEDAPATDLEELRVLARRSDTMILPPPRYVLMGAAEGELPQPIFTPREEPTPTPSVAKASQAPTPPPIPPLTRAAGYEFPPVAPPASLSPFGAAPEQAAPAPQWSSNWNFAPPEVAPAESMPFGGPFAVPGPEAGAPIPPPWQWEPPEGEEPKP